MKPDSLIFDLDGTLWDATAAVANARNIVYAELEIDHPQVTPTEVARTAGMPVDEIYRDVFAQLTDSQREGAKRRLSEEIGRQIRIGGSHLYPDVQDGLEVLRGRYKLFIVSNCSVPYLASFFEFSGLKNLFQDSECYGRTKMTKAENLRELVKRNTLTTPLYIGDTASDEKAASEAGVAFAHAAYGYGKPENSEGLAFTSFGELTRTLLES